MGCWNNWICIYFNKGSLFFALVVWMFVIWKKVDGDMPHSSIYDTKGGAGWRFSPIIWQTPRYLAMFCLNNTRMHLNNLFNINISFLYIYRSSLRCYISLLVIIIYIMNWCIESFILYKRKGSSTILKLILISNPSW